jgi:predicted nucleotidyltransferase
MTGREPASVGQTGVMTLVGDHRRVAEVFARELSERREVEVALFHGSAVRGEAVEGSDVDLLGVTGEEDLELGRFHHRDGLVVDLVIHGCVGGLERLGRPRPMWVYAFVEAEPLVDLALALLAHRGHRPTLPGRQ